MCLRTNFARDSLLVSVTRVPTSPSPRQMSSTTTHIDGGDRKTPLLCTRISIAEVLATGLPLIRMHPLNRNRRSLGEAVRGASHLLGRSSRMFAAACGRVFTQSLFWFLSVPRTRFYPSSSSSENKLGVVDVCSSCGVNNESVDMYKGTVDARRCLRPRVAVTTSIRQRMSRAGCGRSLHSCSLR